MAILEKFKNFYYALEDKYYDFLDAVDEHIPVYRIVDPIDRVFPSFLLFILVGILLIGGLSFVLLGGMPGSPSTLGTIKVTDSQGTALEGITLRIQLAGKSETTDFTNSQGIVRIDLEQERTSAHLTINAANFEAYEEDVLLVAGIAKLVVLQPAGAADFSGNFLLRIKNQETGNLINDQLLTISYRCSDSIQSPTTQTTSSGQVQVEKNLGCGTLYASVTPNHSYYPASNVPVTASPQDILLEPTAAPSATTGFLDVRVKTASHQPKSGALVTISTENEPSLQQATTNSQGKTSFELEAGTYHVAALVATTGQTASATATITAGQTTDINLTLGNAPPLSQKIFLKVIDSNTLEPINLVQAKIYQNTSFLIQKYSDSNGYIEQAVIPEANTVFSVVLTNSNYLVKLIANAPVKNGSDTNATIVRMEKTTSNPKNYGEALVLVSSPTDPHVKDARTYLYRTDYPNPLLGPYMTDTDGNALFSNLPPLQNDNTSNPPKYFATAVKSYGISESKFIGAGERVLFPITLEEDTGKFLLTIRDLNTHQTIANANIRVFVIQDNQEQTLQNGYSNSQGQFETAALNVNQTVFFAVSKNGYLTHVTTGNTPIANQTVELPPIFLAPNGMVPPGQIFLAFSQLLDSENHSAQIMESGKRYWAVFSLGLPENRTYNRPIAHIEAGLRDEDHLWADQNPVVIQNALAFPENLEDIIFSRALDPSAPFSNPLPVGSNSNAKQVNIDWNHLNQGTFEVRVAFDTNSNASDGTEIFLYYQSKATVTSGDINSALLFQRFVIGQSVCQFDCNAFFWRFYYALDGEDDYQEVTANPRPELEKNQAYNLQYKLYNLSNTTFSNAGLVFSSDPEEITVGAPNGYSARTIPPGLDNYGMQNPQRFLPIYPSLSAWLDGNLSTTPPVSDSSNRFRRYFIINGDKELSISHSRNPNPPNDLNITVTDLTEETPISGANVKIQKAGCSVDMESFTFNPSDSSYRPGTTEPNGSVIFAAYQIESSECAIVEASAEEYQPKRIKISGASNPNPSSDLECIQIDTDPNTPAIDSLFEGAERGQNHDIQIVSSDCPLVHVSIHTLDATMGNIIRTDEVSFTASGFNPANFVLNPNETKTITVTIGSNAPLGYVPIIAFASASEPISADYFAAFAELVVTPRVNPNQDAFGVVREPA